MTRPATLSLRWVSFLLLFASVSAADEVQLTVLTSKNGRGVSFEVSGPPRAPFVVVGSPFDNGTVLPSGQVLRVSVMHPFRDAVHFGKLDDQGNARWTMPLPVDARAFPSRFYLQAVAIPSGKLDDQVRVSRAVCLLKGPPLRVVRAVDRRSWFALAYLLPIFGLLAVQWVRRRPGVLLVLPAAALVVLPFYPGRLYRPLARFMAHGMDGFAAKERLLGIDVLQVLGATAEFVPQDAILVIAADCTKDFGRPLYVAYFLAPRRVLYGERALHAESEEGTAVFYCARERGALPSGFDVEPISGFRVADLRLYRVRRP